MNLPNKLTLIRIFMIPVIMIVYGIFPKDSYVFYSSLSTANFIILIIVIICSLTDYLDGTIARRRNLVTNFGKFLDPLADKMLIVTVLLILMDESKVYGTNLITWWMVLLILAREFMVTGLRQIAVVENRVIAASWYGKIKTTIQFLTLIFLLFGSARPVINGDVISLNIVYVFISKLLIYVMLVVTVFSGIDYLVKNKDILFMVGKNKKKSKKSNQ